MSFWKKISDAFHRMNYPDIEAAKKAHPSNYNRPMVTDKTLEEYLDELNRILGEPSKEEQSRDHMYGNGRGGYRVPNHHVLDQPTQPDDFSSLDEELRELCSLGESWSGDAPKMAGMSQSEPDEDPKEDLPHGGDDLLEPPEGHDPCKRDEEDDK